MVFSWLQHRMLVESLSVPPSPRMYIFSANCGLAVFNLGTGQGYSVLDVVKAFEKANGLKLPYEIKPRRPGDIATCYSSPEKAKRELGWEAEYGIEEMCRDSWNWQKNNPNGYKA